MVSDTGESTKSKTIPISFTRDSNGARWSNKDVAGDGVIDAEGGEIEAEGDDFNKNFRLLKRKLYVLRKPS